MPRTTTRFTKAFVAVVSMSLAFASAPNRAAAVDVFLVNSGTSANFTSNTPANWKTTQPGTTNPSFGTGALTADFEYVLLPNNNTVGNHKVLASTSGNVTFISTMKLYNVDGITRGLLQISNGIKTFDQNGGLIMNGGFVQFNTSAGTLAGSVTLETGTVKNVFQTNFNGIATVTANIAGDGPVQITRGGTSPGTNGVMLFTGTNTYTGDTNIGTTNANAILFRVGSLGAIPSGAGKGNIQFDVEPENANNHILDLNGFNTNINGLNGTSTANRVSGRVLAGSGAVSLSLGNGDANGAFAGTIINNNSTLSLTKTGTGKQTLSGVNTYSGTTQINGGVLEIAGAGTINSTSGITINGGELNYDSSATLNKNISFGASGGTISGIGTIGTLVTAGNLVELSPGNSPGTQNYAAGLNWANGGSYTWEINDALNGPANSGNSFVGHDLLNITGTLDLSGITSPGGFTIDLVGLTAGNLLGPVPNFIDENDWVIATASGGIVGFNESDFFLNSINLPGAYALSVDGNNLVLTQSVVPIPEPSSCLLLMMGLIGLRHCKRKRLS